LHKNDTAPAVTNPPMDFFAKNFEEFSDGTSSKAGNFAVYAKKAMDVENKRRPIMPTIQIPRAAVV
jgi:hypothetical protein